MTLSADIAFEEYTIVDVDAPLSFAHPWEFNDEIVVFEDGVLLDIGTDYSLTGAGAPGGGQINPVAATLASRWTAYRFTRLAQTSVPSDAIVGFALDRLTRAIQDARRDSDRSLKIDDETVLDIPVPIQPGKPLIGNATADGFAYGTSSVDADLAALEAQIDSVAADLDTEEATRASQDGALSDMIVAETVARTSAIGNEATARATQDDVLLGLILADGGLSDPADLQVYLGLDVTNASLATAQGDITTLQSEMNTAQADIDAAEAAILLKLNASAVSAFGFTLIDDAAATNALTTLGFSTYGKTLIDDADASAAQTTLGISTFVKTILDDAAATNVLTTLGFSTFGKTLIDDADASALQTSIGISAFVKTLLDDADANAFLTTLGIKTNYDALVTLMAALQYATGTYVPVLTPGSGSFTSTGTPLGNYVRIGKTCTFKAGVTITSIGTGSGTLNMTLPFNPETTGFAIITGRENAVNGKLLQGVVTTTNSMSILNYDNTSPMVNGARPIMSGTYIIA